MDTTGEATCDDCDRYFFVVAHSSQFVSARDPHGCYCPFCGERVDLLLTRKGFAFTPAMLRTPTAPVSA